MVNPPSRVVVIAELAGKPIHATPLYSIMSNVAIGLLLGRLWALGARAWPIVGAYLLLAGLARFVEEGFRASPRRRGSSGCRSTSTWRPPA